MIRDVASYDSLLPTHRTHQADCPTRRARIQRMQRPVLRPFWGYVATEGEYGVFISHTWSAEYSLPLSDVVAAWPRLVRDVASYDSLLSTCRTHQADFPTRNARIQRMQRPVLQATGGHPSGSERCPWATRSMGMKPRLGHGEKTLRWKGVLPLNPPNRRIRDPYVRWCGRGGAVRLPPIPIRLRKKGST